MKHEGDERNEFSGEQSTRESETENSSRDDGRDDSSSSSGEGSGGHVFRIVPADPKNNFDFEDVADK